MFSNAKKYIFIGSVICFIWMGCDKSTTSSTPNGTTAGYVDQYLNLSLPSNNNLNVVTGWVYIPQGIKGIIVYRKSNSEFLAYERNCTYNDSKGCNGPLTVDINNFVVDTCKSCGSKFLIQDGSVNKGPASIPLVHYQTQFDAGANTVHVFN